MGFYQEKLGRMLVPVYDPDPGNRHVEMLGENLDDAVVGRVPLGAVPDRDLEAVLGLLRKCFFAGAGIYFDVDIHIKIMNKLRTSSASYKNISGHSRRYFHYSIFGFPHFSVLIPDLADYGPDHEDGEAHEQDMGQEADQRIAEHPHIPEKGSKEGRQGYHTETIWRNCRASRSSTEPKPSTASSRTVRSTAFRNGRS